MDLRTKTPSMLLLCALALAACSREAPQDVRTEPPLVRIATVGNNPQAERSFTGIVSAKVQSNLGFRVPGKVVERLVDSGQAVHRGQKLMLIDPTDLALANLAQVGAVEAARALALQTAADEKRFRTLVNAGAVSRSAYDRALAAANSAQAQLNAAQAQANVSKNEAAYSVLVADADGIVVETLAEPGQVVTAGQTVVRLAHAGPREATINLPETLRPELGSTAKAGLFNATGAQGSARLRQLSNSADPSTRTFEAKYVLEGPAADSPLGATVSIQLADPRQGTSMQVPLSAIYDNGKGPGVWIVEGQEKPTVKWRAVQLAALGEETATVISGLNADERFVALGAHLLHQDQAVRIASEQVAVQ